MAWTMEIILDPVCWTTNMKHHKGEKGCFACGLSKETQSLGAEDVAAGDKDVRLLSHI